MGKQNTLRCPVPGSFPHIAGEYLYKYGATLERDLLGALETKMRPHEQAEAMQKGVRCGWLTVLSTGQIDCSAGARAHYDMKAGIVPVQYVGQIAAPREASNAFTRPPLRKEYMPNSRGIREIDPRFERPAGFSFKSIAGGGA